MQGELHNIQIFATNQSNARWQTCRVHKHVVLAQVLAPYEAKAQEALRHVPEDSKGAAYQAWLGFYNSSLRKLRWSSEHLVQQANLFSATIG